MHPINSFYESVGEFIDAAVDAHLEEYNLGGPVNPIDYSSNAYGVDPLSNAQHYKCPPFTDVQWIDSYVRKDGTVVKGHWRSEADGITSNNLNPE